MAMIINFYNEAGVYTKTGIVNLESANVKLALLTKDYTPDLDLHDVWADVSNEVADGNGYTLGGKALTNSSVSRSGSVIKWDADDVVFLNLTKTFKYGLVYLDETVNSVVKPLILLIDFDDTSTTSDITVSSINYAVEWHVDGIWEFGPVSEICI